MVEEEPLRPGGTTYTGIASSATTVSQAIDSEAKSTSRSEGAPSALPEPVETPYRRVVLLQRFSSRDESSARSTGRTDRTTGRDSQRSAGPHAMGEAAQQQSDAPLQLPESVQQDIIADRVRDPLHVTC
jgi:hypothetical protein